MTKFVFSNLMTFDEFEEYINSIKDKNKIFFKKCYLLFFKDKKLVELMPFPIMQDLQINKFKRKEMEIYIALEEKGELIKND